MSPKKAYTFFTAIFYTKFLEQFLDDFFCFFTPILLHHFFPIFGGIKNWCKKSKQISAQKSGDPDLRWAFERVKN